MHKNDVNSDKIYINLIEKIIYSAYAYSKIDFCLL